MIYAHGNGVDDFLFTLIPVSLFVVLLALANRRASRAGPRPVDAQQTEEDAPPPSRAAAQQEEIARLNERHASGAISDEELAEEKRRIIDRYLRGER